MSGCPLPSGTPPAQGATPDGPRDVDTGLHRWLQPRRASLTFKLLILLWFSWDQRRQRGWRAGRRRRAATPWPLILVEQALHLAAVGFDPRYPARHVDHQPVAAQHVLALGQYDTAEHGDQIGLGIEHGGLAGHDLVLLRHDHAAARLQPLD